MKSRLDIAIEAARKGASHAMSYYKKNVQVDLKSDLTPVTIADKETENVIREFISKEDPDAKFYGEETGGDFTWEKFWLVDPVDGTIFFTKDIPLWGTLISYIQEGQATIGVSYLPLLDELLYAEKGQGAYLNGEQVHVSSVSDITKSFFTHGSIHRFIDKLPGFLELAKRSHKTKGISEAYQYHLLATGRSEGVFDGNASPWDIAGMKLIIEEAGGTFTDMDGGEWNFTHKDSLATNGKIHDEVLKIIHRK